MGELIFNGFLLIFFAAMLVYSGQIEIWNGHVWARYWPMIILAVGVLLFAIKTWGVFRKLPKEELKFDIKIFGFKERNIQMLLVSFAWLIFYALILPKAGFIISTFIFCVGMQLLLRGKLGWQGFRLCHHRRHLCGFCLGPGDQRAPWRRTPLRLRPLAGVPVELRTCR